MRRSVACLSAALVLGSVLGGCFEQEEATCEFWVPKLTSAARGEKALQMVQELKCVDAIPTLEKLFDDGIYRERILRAVKQIGDKQAAAPVLKRALLTRDTGKLAASIVTDWGLEAAKPELEQILTGPSLPKHRPEALKALLSFAKAEEVEDLLIQLAGDDPNLQGIAVNQVAVEKLGEIRSEKAIPVLVRAAFMRDNRGGMIYRSARVALANLAPKTVPLLVQTIKGDNAELVKYAQENGIQDWEWQAGPEIVQLLTDTLDPRVGKPVVANMARELAEPSGVSPAMQEKWRMAQLNRLKVAMLGLGHVGPADAVEDLVKLVRDPLADAVNQRLHSATALALIGTPQALDEMMKVLEDPEMKGMFKQPFLQPLTLGLDAANLERFQKATEKAEGYLAEGLKHEKVAAYLGVLNECKGDAACWVKKLDSESQDEAVKAAVMLARGIGDQATVRAALIKRFVRAPASDIDIKRFVLIAITRIGTAADGEELLKIAANADAQDVYWPDELRVYGEALRGKGR